MCDCITKIDKQLEKTGKNTILDIPIVFHTEPNQVQLSASRVTVSTRKRDEKKREKPIKVFASYCPFCGEKYDV